MMVQNKLYQENMVILNMYAYYIATCTLHICTYIHIHTHTYMIYDRKQSQS